jgi:hypothetical protein
MSTRARLTHGPSLESPVERLPGEITAALADLAFQSALDLLGHPIQQPTRKWLPRLESHLARRAQQQDPPIREVLQFHRGAWRWTRAFAMHLVLHEEPRLAYVPPQPLRDPRWLRGQLTTGRHTADSLADWLARQGHHTSAAAIHDAMRGLRAEEQTPRVSVAARTYLANKQWLETRVIGRSMLDGAIVDELRSMGCLCDRSTVAWWRRRHGLAPAWQRGGSLAAGPTTLAPRKAGRPRKD